jgi:hypothetical protein
LNGRLSDRPVAVVSPARLRSQDKHRQRQQQAQPGMESRSLDGPMESLMARSIHRFLGDYSFRSEIAFIIGIIDIMASQISPEAATGFLQIEND